MESLAKAFGYSEHQLALIASLRRGEFLLDRDGRITVLNIDTSMYDHYLFTTNRQENSELEKNLTKYEGNLLKAIDQLAKKKELEYEEQAVR